MPGLGNSCWSSKPSEKEVKSPDEAENMSVTSFGFAMPAFANKSASIVQPPVAPTKEESAFKADAVPSQDCTRVETKGPVSKASAAIQTTRDQMAKLVGRRRDRPCTADQTVERGPSASYAGYTKRE
ncbi:hypothetical protein G6011_09838 [Alternaria panax]|uniref:Uncharacterized protein n=1 Tax=Alternaria panax TaxID=48097 RepID=A0AAD4FB90_9PLEO|nr:hypothetical protein G6011_09838 [Alternaria panax]